MRIAFDDLLPARRRRRLRRIGTRAGLGAVPALALWRITGRGHPVAAVLPAIGAAAAIESPGAVTAAMAALTGAIGAASDAPTAAAAVAGTALTPVVFPRIDDAPARTVPVVSRDRVDPANDGAGLVVVVNSGSGGGGATELVEEIEASLPRAEIRLCEPGDDLEDVLADAASGALALGVVGGDGTVDAAARASLHAQVPLVVFPGGTLNHFARDLGVESVAAAVDAVRSGAVVAIDVGDLGGRSFLNNASVGAYAELVDERERLESRLGKWVAMVVALTRVLRRGHRLDLLVDGEPRCVWMVFLGNGRYEPEGFAPSDRPDLVDGMIDVRLVDATAPLSRIRLIGAVLLGALARSKVHEARCVRTITIASVDGSGLRLAADGETFDGPSEVVVGKRPASLLVYVPEPPEAASAPDGGAGS